MSRLQGSRRLGALLLLAFVSLGIATVCDAQVQSRGGSANPASYGFSGNRRAPTRSFVPTHARQASFQTPTVQPAAPMPMEETIIGNPIGAPPVVMDSVHSGAMHGVETMPCTNCGTEMSCGVDWVGGCESCGMGHSGMDSCGGCGSCNTCAARGCLVPCPNLSFRNMEYTFGVQGFKGQPNLGRDGSFGFNAGINWGFDLPCLTSDWFSAQLGVRSVQSNFQEQQLTTQQRDQLFVTAGFFRRVDYGLQGGLVADILYDDWYVEMNLAQLRGQMSWKYSNQSELGFQFTHNIQDDTQPTTNFALFGQTNPTLTWQPLETYRFFYSRPLSTLGAYQSRGTAFAGVSGNGDGLLGADFELPVADRWALTTGFLYLVPESNVGVSGSLQESWNVGINLTFFPRGLGQHMGRYDRPLFNVADNGTFLIDDAPF